MLLHFPPLPQHFKFQQNPRQSRFVLRNDKSQEFIIYIATRRADCCKTGFQVFVDVPRRFVRRNFLPRYQKQPLFHLSCWKAKLVFSCCTQSRIRWQTSSSAGKRIFIPNLRVPSYIIFRICIQSAIVLPQTRIQTFHWHLIRIFHF